MGLFGAVQSAAHSLGVELRPIDLRNVGEIEKAVMAFADTSGARGILYRELIIALAARHRLPAIYAYQTRQGRPDVLRYRQQQQVPSGGGVR